MDAENGHGPAPTENGAAAAAEPPAEPLPEAEAYAYLLALMHLLDRRQPAEVRTAATDAGRSPLIVIEPLLVVSG
jgi:hypothetical protein